MKTKRADLLEKLARAEYYRMFYLTDFILTKLLVDGQNPRFDNKILISA